MSLESIFLATSIFQMVILITQDTVPMFPLNDVQHLNSSMSVKERTLIFVGNTLFFAIALMMQIALYGQPKPIWMGAYVVLLYGVNTVLMYQQWYKYYLFGADAVTTQKYAVEYGRTLHVLPKRGDNPRPNLLHLTLHVLFVSNTLLAVLVGFNLV